MKFSGLWLLLFVFGSTKPSGGVSRKFEGETLRLYWVLDSFEDVKNETITEMLCKNECAEDDVLVQTSGRKEERGRYAITHFRKDSPYVDIAVVYITNLTMSDSGRYRYLFDTPAKRHSTDFVLEVIRATEKNKHDTTPIYTASAGEDLTLPCDFYTSGQTKSFCKNDCVEDVLVRTHLHMKETDRYGIEYKELSTSWSFIFVTITNLTDSDSGTYSCALDQASRKFRIVVEQESTGFLIWIPILALILIVVIAMVIILAVHFKRGAKDDQSPSLTAEGMPRHTGSPTLENNYENFTEFSSENESHYQGLDLDRMETPYSDLYWTNM